ncbi:MAG: ROK family protein, partial [Gemmataceae bacterium]|nr:ROK family protein [Gemmataceae bacterium]
MSGGYWLGVDLGGTKILAGLFDDSMKLLARSKLPTSAEGGAAGVMGRIADGVEAVLREANVDPSQVRGMGLGVPGQVVVGTSRVRFAPNLDWHDVDLKDHAPPGWRWPLVVENDVRMGTYGEYAFGAARGARNVLGVFVGTGVGGGLILNGDLFTGFNGHAGEFGNLVVHWRRGNTVEHVAGRRHMMKRAKDILDDAPKRVRKEWKHVDLAAVRSSQLADYYQKDDPVAVQLIDDAARALAAGIGGVVNFLSPEVVVIGGGVTGSLGDSFIERIWEIAQRYTLPGAANGVKCVPASLGDDSG